MSDETTELARPPHGGRANGMAGRTLVVGA